MTGILIDTQFGQLIFVSPANLGVQIPSFHLPLLKPTDVYRDSPF